MQHGRIEHPSQTVHSIHSDVDELRHLPHHHVQNAFSPLFLQYHHGYGHLSGSMPAPEFPMENQYSFGRMWHVHRRIAFLQSIVPIQSRMVALWFHSALRYPRYSTHFLPSTHFVGGHSWICGRNVLWNHWNFVYLKKININPLNYTL